MKNAKGQMATEFILVLPWLCAVLLAFVVFILFCTRAQLANYAAYMSSRIAGVWPETIVMGEVAAEDKMIEAELGYLMPGAVTALDKRGAEIEVEAAPRAPFGFDILGVYWGFEKTVPVVSEPARACNGEDNPLPAVPMEDC